MTWVDWTIVIVPIVLIAGLAVVMQSYVRGVADFMAASRVAGRYLITNAGAEMGLTVVGAVAMYELVQKCGFTLSWWGKLSIPVGLIMTLWGFVTYRYRETRVMTLAQFFEVRYSKSFRVFAGLVGFISGVINYGIFPALASRFFIYCCGFPTEVHMGGLHIPTMAIIMALYLTATMTMTLTGGHLTIMVTDCVGSLLTVVFYTIIIIVLLNMFSWGQIQTAMSGAPPGESMLNPFDTGSAKDFNIWYVLIGLLGSVYGRMTWQGGHAFNNCASSPHEAKMAGILGNWRGAGQGLMAVLIPICAFTYMHHPDFAEGALRVRNLLQAVPEDQIRTQVTTAVTLSQMLPTGVLGMVVAVFLMGLIACDSSYLHSWGSIFIQDVVLPFRKTPFTPRQHMFLLRLGIFGVAVFGFFFSLFYKQTEFVLMFFAITGAIFSGAGAALLGGLYWKKGTTQAAWFGMIAGSLIAVCGLLVTQPAIWNGIHGMVKSFAGANPGPWLAHVLANWPAKFPINGQWMFLISMVIAVIGYVAISLLTCKEDFNMDRMLHRGKYRPGFLPDEVAKPATIRSRFASFAGIDDDFTKGDRILAWSVVVWSLFWFVLFTVITIWNLIHRWPTAWWAIYWHWEIIIVPILIMVVTTVWFWWGGVRDLISLFKRLRSIKRNPHDDGMVVNHQNLDDAEASSGNGSSPETK